VESADSYDVANESMMLPSVPCVGCLGVPSAGTGAEGCAPMTGPCSVDPAK
jgi:hypothetical protein